MDPPVEEMELSREELGEFAEYLEAKKASRTSLSMLSVSALHIAKMTPTERDWPSPIGMKPGFCPPTDFLADVPTEFDGACLLATVRMYHSDRGTFIALLDLGAQIPVVRASKLPAEAWNFKIKVEGRLYGFAGSAETTYLVPVAVAFGTSQGHGLWLWAIPMEDLPHQNVDIVIDYVTCTAFLLNLDFNDPAMVKINTRSKSELEEKIRFFKENDMKGTRTDCVPRKYAMASFDPLE